MNNVLDYNELRREYEAMRLAERNKRTTNNTRSTTSERVKRVVVSVSINKSVMNKLK